MIITVRLSISEGQEFEGKCQKKSLGANTKKKIEGRAKPAVSGEFSAVLDLVLVAHPFLCFSIFPF